MVICFTTVFVDLLFLLLFAFLFFGGLGRFLYCLYLVITQGVKSFFRFLRKLPGKLFLIHLIRHRYHSILGVFRQLQYTPIFSSFLLAPVVSLLPVGFQFLRRLFHQFFRFTIRFPRTSITFLVNLGFWVVFFLPD